MANPRQIENLKRILSSQSFADWYGDEGDFGRWLIGEFPSKSQEYKNQTAEINEQIASYIERINKG